MGDNATGYMFQHCQIDALLAAKMIGNGGLIHPRRFGQLAGAHAFESMFAEQAQACPDKTFWVSRVRSLSLS